MATKKIRYIGRKETSSPHHSARLAHGVLQHLTQKEAREKLSGKKDLGGFENVIDPAAITGSSREQVRTAREIRVRS
jgi:hypothetical protein